MTNSIIANLDSYRTASAIRLMLSSDDKCFIVVEGPFDSRLLSCLVAKDVVIVESFSGKKGIEKIVHDLFPGERRVIGIRDKDYQIEPVDARIFYNDFSCAEMMIVSIPECFQRVCTAHGIFCECFDSFFSEVLQALCFLSCLRKLNEINDWGCCFKGIHVVALYRNDISEFSSSLLVELNRQNPSNTIDSYRRRLVEEEVAKCSTVQDLLWITNGHDFIELLQWHANKFGKNPSKDSISDSLISVFVKHFFEATSLHRSLKNYSEHNGFSFLT